MHRWRFLAIVMAVGMMLAACTSAPQASPSPEGSEPAATQGGGETEGAETQAPAESEEPTGEGQPGGTLVFAGARLAQSLDPALTSDGESFRVLQQVYEPLVDLEPGSATELTGILAESWEGEPDGTEYVFTLREGVTFHDGTEFNADAVVTNFERWNEFAEEFQADAYYYGAVMGGFGEGSNLESIEATDDLEVTITLKEPNPAFLLGIALTPFAIVSPAVLESTNASDPAASTFGTDLVQAGTGPFILDSYTPDEEATFSRNEDYWGDPAFLDRLIIQPIADPAARLQALQAGDIQGFDLVSPTDYEAVEEDGFQLVERESFNTFYVAVNNASAPLDDLNVRLAVAHAIDKEALIEPFYGGRAVAADSFLPPTSQYDESTDQVEAIEFDPEEARRLLDEAGFDEANPATLEFWYPTGVSRPYMPDPEGLAEAIVAQLEDVGFVVEVNSSDWSTEYTTAAQNGQYPVHFLGWTGDYDDPNNWYGAHFGFRDGEPAAQFGFGPEGFEEALDEANAAVEPEARGEAWQAVAAQVVEEVAFVPIVHADTALAFTPEVQGYLPNPTGSETFVSVYLTEGE